MLGVVWPHHCRHKVRILDVGLCQPPMDGERRAAAVMVAGSSFSGAAPDDEQVRRSLSVDLAAA